MFRKLFFALSVSTALCVPSYAEAEIISDSIAQALMSHPQMKAGEASMAAAGKNVQEQKSGFFPVLGVDGRAGRMHNNDETTRGATPDQGGATTWLGEGTVRVTQPLFAGYGIVNRVQGAEDRASAATYDLDGIAEDVALRAARAHLNLMRTRDLLDLASVFLSNIEDRRDKIDLMVKEGAADAAELMLAEEIGVGAKNTKLGYEEAFRQANADYIEAVGAEPVEDLALGDPVWNGLIPATLDDAVTNAAHKNARILAAGSIVAALGSETRAEKSSLAPRLDAEMSFTQKDQADEVGGELSSAQAVVRMGWNFSTGGGQFARIDKLRLQKQEAAARRQALIRNIERDVRQKYASMEIVDQQFSLMVDREKSSEKILENYLAQFEGGKQSNLQLISSHSRMFESRAARTDAQYRQILSRLELLNTTGRLREAFGAMKPQAKK